MASSEAVNRPRVGGGAAKRTERTMDGNFTIGRFGGIEVRLHWSLLAVFALIVRDVGPVGVVTVSGLPQVEDHRLVVSVLRDHLATRT